MDLVFKLPGKDTPGFLRRQREAIRFSENLKDNPTVETVDALVSFLVDYVEEPKDRKEAAEALWDASENQFMELLGALSGGQEAENPTP